MKKIAALFCIAVLYTSCTKPGGSPTTGAAKPPEEVVRNFVELSGNAKEATDKRRLEELTSGELRRAFSNMSDETFKMAYLNNAVKVNDLKVLENQTDKEHAKILYQVSVENKGGTEPTNEVNEREVLLTLSQGAWYIESIRPKGVDKLAFTRGMIF